MFTELTLKVENVGLFTVDWLMGIKFTPDWTTGDDAEFTWHSHASKLNQGQYPAMYRNFMDFWWDKGFSSLGDSPSEEEFIEIGEKLFHMYCLLR